MLREISRRYWWKGMQQACIDFVDNCEHCQRMKNRTQRASGTMAEVEEPESMGIAYSADFLTHLDAVPLTFVSHLPFLLA